MSINTEPEKRRAYHRAYYKKRQEFYTNKTKTHHKQRLAQINKIKIELGGCQLCDEKEPACLDFHHISNKSGGISNICKRWSWDRVLEEIKKCILICANCHRKLHAGIISIDERVTLD